MNLNKNSIFEIDIYLPFPKNLKKIYFGMGCFWGAEKVFWGIEGIYTTIVGYSGGHKNQPTYEEVCNGNTGHAEVVSIVFEESILPIKNLLKVFWESHDPTQINRQGNDIGTQYRSSIYVENKKQLDIAINSKNKFQTLLFDKGFGKIETEISLCKEFYFAEEYHQKYLYKNPSAYCDLNGLGLKLDI